MRTLIQSLHLNEIPVHIKFEMNSSRIAVLNVSLQERCLKDQTAGPTTRDSDLGSLGGAQEFVCLTSSQVMLMLLLQGPHFESSRSGGSCPVSSS